MGNLQPNVVDEEAQMLALLRQHGPSFSEVPQAIRGCKWPGSPFEIGRPRCKSASLSGPKFSMKSSIFSSPLSRNWYINVIRDGHYDDYNGVVWEALSFVLDSHPFGPGHLHYRYCAIKRGPELVVAAAAAAMRTNEKGNFALRPDSKLLFLLSYALP